MRIFYSPNHRLHAPDRLLVDGRPFSYEEKPERVEIILQALMTARLGPVSEPSDHGLQPILEVHDPGYIHYLQNIYRENATAYGRPQPVFAETFATRNIRRRSSHLEALKGYYSFGVGSPVLEGTWTAAYWSAQCALSAADCLKAGEGAAYALCRPPGHHAAADLYGGFCYLNNAAIAARYLGPQTAILDIDYHHGNGTQEIFYHESGWLYCSLHADPDQDYPYFWGAACETGEGPGEGYNRNWPLPPGTSEQIYLQVLDEALQVIRSFQPKYLVLSAGLDIAEGDEVGGFRVSRPGFAEIGRRIASLGFPTVIVQEGGYRLDTLGENALALLSAWS
jgi:acetoin utilization deacetylase AcuC-like enzyme